MSTITKPATRKQRPNYKNLKAFNARAAELIRRLGGYEKHSGDFILHSRAGDLELRIVKGITGVMSRFADPQAAIVFTDSIGRPCNQYSGKWNFHYFGNELVPATVDSDLAWHLEQLAAYQPTAEQLAQVEAHRAMHRSRWGKQDLTVGTLPATE